MVEEDSIFKDAGLRLFGEGFSKKAKKRDDEMRALDEVSLSSTLSSFEKMLRTSVDMLCMFELSVCRQFIICSRGSDV